VLNASNAPNANAIAAWKAYGQKRSAARTALNSVRPGREALPLITNWLATEPLPWKMKLGQRLRAYNADHLNLSVDRRALAWDFLSEFPIGAGNELLPYVRAATNSTNQLHVIQAVVAFVRNLRSAKNVDVEEAMRFLMPLKYQLGSSQGFGPYYRFSSWSHELEGAIESLDPQRLLRPMYVLEFGPIPERVGAAMELTSLPRMPERAVPLLIANLLSTNRSVQEQCANALSKYGAAARDALPSLTNLLTHPRARLRLAASNAIVAIHGTNELALSSSAAVPQ
jgi:hypothetical protein